MNDQTGKKRENSNISAPLPPAAEAELRALVKRAKGASGPVMKAINYAGGKVEGWLDVLPAPARTALEGATTEALDYAYGAATTVRGMRAAPDMGRWGHKIAVTLSGGAGGFAGLASSVVELPATVSIMFGAIQKIAGSYGFDPQAEAVRAECLTVFASGTPLKSDDGVDMSFLASRVALTGAGIQALIARVAPKLAVVLGQKLAAQAVPLVGAVAGAGVNLAFLRYYEELAHVRFGLLKLARDLPDHDVMAAFHALAAPFVRQVKP